MKTMTKRMLGLCCAAIMTASLAAQQAGNVMLSNGMKYVSVPYVAHTLESDEPESLIINCDEVDCTTFVEYVLAESLAPKQADGDILESDFAELLQKIRYRDGIVDGYSSRLHYISDWIENGVRNGLIEDVTATRSDDTQRLALSYMSTHPQEYKQLALSKEELAKIKKIEQSLSGRTIHYLPKDKVPTQGLQWIKDGDIIAITTNTPGLDIAHLGIAIYVDDKLTLLHASSTEKKVVVSNKTLDRMLQDQNKWTGIRVLRMKKD